LVARLLARFWGHVKLNDTAVGAPLGDDDASTVWRNGHAVEAVRSLVHRDALAGHAQVDAAHLATVWADDVQAALLERPRHLAVLEVHAHDLQLAIVAEAERDERKASVGRHGHAARFQQFSARRRAFAVCQVDEREGVVAGHVDAAAVRRERDV
jgi:hypothetical protein